MSVEVACNCDDGFGLSHSHVYEPAVEKVDGVDWLRSRPTGWVRLWVDWRAVARGLALGRATS